MYPCIEIDLKKLEENVAIAKAMAKEKGVDIAPVVKVYAGDTKVVNAIASKGPKYICDSRIENLKGYTDVTAEKWLIRLPMVSEAEDAVRYADASLNTEGEAIKALNEAAKAQGKIHKVILMYELGDLREGCSEEELDQLIEMCKSLPNIKLYGLGANLSCYGEILPDEKNMEELDQLVGRLEERHGIKFEVVSGGNSSSYNMLKEGKLPKCINNLRLGESIILANVPCFEIPIEELNGDSFVLKAEIIELKEKPSVPWGTSGLCNSFSEEVEFEDRGIRKRAILALGRQDVNTAGLTPMDEKIDIIGASSDHLIMDVTDSEEGYRVGDIISFKLNYSALLTAMSGKYIERIYK